MMNHCSSLEQYKTELNQWADEHLTRKIKNQDGSVTEIIGRSALPEGLQVPSDSNPQRYANSIRTETMNVSPKGDCPG